MDFTAFYAAILAWCEYVIPGGGAGVQDGQKPFQIFGIDGVPPMVDVDEPSICRAVGIDWRTYDSAGVPTVVGNRELDVAIRVAGRSHKMSISPFGAADLLRGSLKKPYVLETLRNAGIAVARIGKTANYADQFENRRRPIAVLPVTFAVVAEYVDADSSGVIEHVGVTSAIKGVSGTILATPPNFVKTFS